MLLISIPKPCHENWDNMSAREQGSFCAVCARTVVDFTRLSDEDVKNYFLRHRGQKTCGRFRNDQLAEPGTLHELLSRPIPFWKKFLAIVCIVFGSFLSSCQNTTAGKIKDHELISVGEAEIKCDRMTMGISLTERVPDTVSAEFIYPLTTKGDIDVEMIEPTLIETDGVMPIETTDTLVFQGQIKADSVAKVLPPLSKVDSVKINIPSNNCDSIPATLTEP